MQAGCLLRRESLLAMQTIRGIPTVSLSTLALESCAGANLRDRARYTVASDLFLSLILCVVGFDSLV